MFYLNTKCLRKLTALRFLIIYKNQIEQLKPETFEKLTNLIDLDYDLDPSSRIHAEI